MIIRLCRRCRNTHIECEGLKLGCGVIRGPRDWWTIGEVQASVLRRFMLAPEAIVTVREMADWVWGWDASGGPEDIHNALQVHLSHLRRKLSSTGAPWAIKGECYRGYVFTREAAQSEAA